MVVGGLVVVVVVVGWKENTTYRMYLFTSLHFQKKTNSGDLVVGSFWC